MLHPLPTLLGPGLSRLWRSQGRQAPAAARKPGGKGPGRPREVSAGQRAADWGVWEVFLTLTDPPSCIRLSVRVRILVMCPCSHQFPWEENPIYNKVNLLKKVPDPTHLLHPQPALWPHDSAGPAPQKPDHSGQQCGAALEEKSKEGTLSRVPGCPATPRWVTKTLNKYCEL